MMTVINIHTPNTVPESNILLSMSAIATNFKSA